MDALTRLFLPTQASTLAPDIDAAFMFILFLNVVFFLLIAGLTILFAYNFKRKSAADKTSHITHNMTLELIWSIGPLLILTVVFFWGFNDYMLARTPPGESMEIQVTAKKWNWTFEYPDGSVTFGKLYVPDNADVKLVMHSQDVLHSFFVPAFRIKQDVLPNRYTELWFRATQAGSYVVPCTEYCGKDHSRMQATIIADSRKYEDFLENGDPDQRNMPLDQLGKTLYESAGCNSCHSLTGEKGQGPSWKGIYGSQHVMADGKSMLVDDNYIRTSILQPQAMLVQGYGPIMPSYQGQLRERQISALIAYIKTVK
jgi:cytochrome c oxidase subunit II